jgi:formamidopyrimidine-DNA glycosylase
MPELPEVESVRRGLARARLRAKVTELWRSRSLLRIGAAWRDERLECLVGATPGTVDRRGKYIVWHFRGDTDEPSGPADLGLVIHLGMSGRFGLARADQPHAPHTHFVLRFADDREVRLVDPRRFGGLRAGRLEDLVRSSPLDELGPEPLSPAFDGRVLESRAGTSTRALRDVLLDQHVVAGVGNIYAVEALHLARLHPLLPAARLRSSAWDRLAGAVQTVLRQAIDNGGTTLRDFRDVSGKSGRNQDELRVYGRAGEACPGCGAPLRGFVHGGRSGVFCPRDQARPRGRVP